MLGSAIFATLGGVLVGVSRSVNGRLALATSALSASFWNHLIGFLFLSALALLWRGLMPDHWPDAPPTAWAGGTIGVLFVAAGSWLIARIGAAATAMLVIAGQMISGVALDMAMGRVEGLWVKALGVALILGGMAVQRRR
ncbi:MAG TPA: DMT family transporter [Paracoccaceae bacterium]|nr:DMT family transporter [Paracoccaceae bacterium]